MRKDMSAEMCTGSTDNDTTTWTAANWLAYGADCDRRGSYFIRDCAYAQAQKLLALGRITNGAK